MVKCESLRMNMFRITHTGKSINFPVTITGYSNPVLFGQGNLRVDILGCIWRVFFLFISISKQCKWFGRSFATKNPGYQFVQLFRRKFLAISCETHPLKIIIKYARKICMENPYTLTSFFIIRITRELLQTAILKGLVIIYHLSGGGGGCRGEGLCWWRTLLESRLPDTPSCSSVHFYDSLPSAVISNSLTFNSL